MVGIVWNINTVAASVDSYWFAGGYNNSGIVGIVRIHVEHLVGLKQYIKTSFSTSIALFAVVHSSPPGLHVNKTYCKIIVKMFSCFTLHVTTSKMI